jgi:hypothetical protein
MLGLMHEAEPYGHLVLGAKAMDYKTLSRVISVDIGEVKRAVKELTDRGVCNRTDDGVIFSRRMIRDKEKREKLAENGAKGGLKTQSSPKTPNQINQIDRGVLLKQTLEQDGKPQRPEARDQKERDNLPAQPVNPGNGGCAAPMASPEPEAPPGNEFDRVQAECSRAIGAQAPLDLVIGPMVELVRKYGQERVNFQLQSESRRQRRTPIKRWGLWAEIVAERLLEKHGVDPPNPSETGPKIDIGGTFPWPEQSLKRAVDNWRERSESWYPQWGEPPDANEKIRMWAENKGISLEPVEESA